MLLCLLPAPAAADWSCDGDPLRVETVAGAVDPTGLPGGIPNTSAGTLPPRGDLLPFLYQHEQLDAPLFGVMDSVELKAGLGSPRSTR